MTKLFQLVINKPLLVSVTVGTGLAFIFLWSVVNTASTHLTSRADGVFIAWTINWVGHALSTGQDVFQAPIFYPHGNALAFSDPFLSSGVVNIVFEIFTKNLVLQHNLHLLLGTIACFVGMYLLVWDRTGKQIAAYLTATFFTFSSLHLHYVVHLHTYLIAGLPLVLYGFQRWVDSQRPRWLLFSSLTFLAQTLNAPMTSFFSGFCLVPFVFTKKSLRVIKQHLLHVLSVTVMTVAIAGLFYLPYFNVSQEFGYTRSIRDAAHFAHSIERFFTLELGVVYVMVVMFARLGALGSSLSLARRPRAALFSLLNQFDKQALWLILIGGVLMLGPVLKSHDQTVKVFNQAIPLPYAVLYYLIPGFQAFRASSRWIVVFNLGLSLLLGHAVAKTRLGLLKMIAIVLVFTSFLWVTQAPTLSTHAIPVSVPTIYTDVAAQPQSTLAEFLVYMWGMHPYNVNENDRLLYQPIHRKKMYNGVSGFTPPAREYLWLTLSQHLPDPTVINHLRANGIELLVVHFDEYQRLHDDKYAPESVEYPSAEQLRIKIESSSRLHKVSCHQAACLYTIE